MSPASSMTPDKRRAGDSPPVPAGAHHLPPPPVRRRLPSLESRPPPPPPQLQPLQTTLHPPSSAPESDTRVASGGQPSFALPPLRPKSHTQSAPGWPAPRDRWWSAHELQAGGGPAASSSHLLNRVDSAPLSTSSAASQPASVQISPHPSVSDHFHGPSLPAQDRVLAPPGTGTSSRWTPPQRPAHTHAHSLTVAPSISGLPRRSSSRHGSLNFSTGAGGLLTQPSEGPALRVDQALPPTLSPTVSAVPRPMTPRLPGEMGHDMPTTGQLLARPGHSGPEEEDVGTPGHAMLPVGPSDRPPVSGSESSRLGPRMMDDAGLVAFDDQDPDEVGGPGRGAGGGDAYANSRSPELRMNHKLAERKRRQEMKDLFEDLRSQLPDDQGTRTSKWEILTRAIEHIIDVKNECKKLRWENDRLRRFVKQGGLSDAGPSAGGAAAGMSSGVPTMRSPIGQHAYASEMPAWPGAHDRSRPPPHGGSPPGRVGPSGPAPVAVAGHSEYYPWVHQRSDSGPSARPLESSPMTGRWPPSSSGAAPYGPPPPDVAPVSGEVRMGRPPSPSARYYHDFSPRTGRRAVPVDPPYPPAAQMEYHRPRSQASGVSPHPHQRPPGRTGDDIKLEYPSYESEMPFVPPEHAGMSGSALGPPPPPTANLVGPDGYPYDWYGMDRPMYVERYNPSSVPPPVPPPVPGPGPAHAGRMVYDTGRRPPPGSQHHAAMAAMRAHAASAEPEIQPRLRHAQFPPSQPAAVPPLAEYATASASSPPAGPAAGHPHHGFPGQAPVTPQRPPHPPLDPRDHHRYYRPR